MKKLVILIITLISSFSITFAQQDAGAKTILSKMSSKYKAYSSINANFILKIIQGKQVHTQKGVLWLKGIKYKVVLSDQELLSDGKSVWSYVKDNQEVELTNVQKSSSQGFDPTTIFTFYEKGYKYVQEPDIKKGAFTYYVIDLVPTAISNYFKVRLTIDKKSTSLSSVEVFSKDASRLLYSLAAVKPNVKIADQFFVFDQSKYPSVDVVDLR